MSKCLKRPRELGNGWLLEKGQQRERGEVGDKGKVPKGGAVGMRDTGQGRHLIR